MLGFKSMYFSAEITISTEELSLEELETNEDQIIREACDELTEHFKHRLVEALLRSTRHSLDLMRKRFLSRYKGCSVLAYSASTKSYHFGG